MKDWNRLLWLGVGIFLGGAGAAFIANGTHNAFAGNDRFEDYIICTGPVAVAPGAPTDGIWLLDYRSGKLLGSVIDRSAGKIVSWAEVDLVNEFNIQPKANVHFMMTTGSISQGQAALYVAETTTAKVGVYTMGPRPDGRPGIAIRRHDLTMFRARE